MRRCDSVATGRLVNAERDLGGVGRGWRRLVLIVSLGLLVASCVAPSVAPTPASEPAQGQAVYAARCAACHDPGANKAPPLVGKAPELGRVEELVRRGNGKHPTYNSSVLSDDQIRALVEYLRTRTATP